MHIHTDILLYLRKWSKEIHFSFPFLFELLLVFFGIVLRWTFFGIRLPVRPAERKMFFSTFIMTFYFSTSQAILPKPHEKGLRARELACIWPFYIYKYLFRLWLFIKISRNWSRPLFFILFDLFVLSLSWLLHIFYSIEHIARIALLQKQLFTRIPVDLKCVRRFFFIFFSYCCWLWIGKSGREKRMKMNLSLQTGYTKSTVINHILPYFY